MAISRAERALGLHSRSVVFAPSLFGFADQEVLFKPHDGLFRRELKAWGVVARALRCYDVIHYNFGRPILDPFTPRALRGASRYPRPLTSLFDTYRKAVGMRDLPLLKRLGKVIFVTYYGNDARIKKFFRSFPFHLELDTEKHPFEDLEDTVKASRMAYFAKYADRIFALTPDLLHTLPSKASFLPYFSVDLSEWKPEDVGTPDPNRPVRLLHAPSSRNWKGTKYVLAAVERLRNEGMAFDLQLVENVPHSQVRGLYEASDLVIDQLLAGWYGVLAVECMALGKPVIAYIREEDLKFVPPEMQQDLPVINANPDTIYDVLKRCLLMDRAELRAIGVRSRQYVERWHDPLKIAAHLRDEAYQVLAERRARKGARHQN